MAKADPPAARKADNRVGVEMKAGVELFRKLALALPNTTESSHMGNPDFRVVDARGKMRIFATLSAQDRGMGVLLLTLEQQQSFVAEMPELFEPVQGGWGRMGMTYVQLKAVSHEILQGALATAHRNAEWKATTAEGTRSAGKKPKIARIAPKKAANRAKKAPERKD